MLMVLVTTGDGVVVGEAWCQLRHQLARCLCSNGLLLQCLTEARLLGHGCLELGLKNVALPDGLVVLAEGIVTLGGDVDQVCSGLAQFVGQLQLPAVALLEQALQDTDESLGSVDDVDGGGEVGLHAVVERVGMIKRRLELGDNTSHTIQLRLKLVTVMEETVGLSPFLMSPLPTPFPLLACLAFLPAVQ